MSQFQEFSEKLDAEIQDAPRIRRTQRKRLFSLVQQTIDEVPPGTTREEFEKIITKRIEQTDHQHAFGISNEANGEVGFSIATLLLLVKIAMFIYDLLT